MDNNMYSIEQVAELLGVHYRTIWQLVVRGKIKSVKVGKLYRISADEYKRIQEEGAK